MSINNQETSEAGNEHDTTEDPENGVHTDTSQSSLDDAHSPSKEGLDLAPVDADSVNISNKQPGDLHSDSDTITTYPGGLKLAVIIISLQLACFCVALDNTIIATAIPKITDDFGTLRDVGWYGSAYLLFVSAFQLFYGRLYSIADLKWTFIASIFLFEVGSLVAAVSPNSVSLIIGRAISGLGAAGVFTGALTILAAVVPLPRRALFTGLVSAVFGIASVVGPLLGGALTDEVSWRWCFYINLPIGGVTIMALSFLLHLPKSSPKQAQTWKATLLRFDPLGTCLFAPSIICLLLALQWGGTTYAWSSGRIVALLTVFGVLLVGFAATQICMGDNATVPLRIIRQRSIACAVLFALCVSGSFFVMAYYIPIWFQAIHGDSAVHSGIDLLPLMVSIVLFIIIGGIGTTILGYCNVFMFAPITLGAVGAGLIFTWTVDTPKSRWIGYQILYGVGVGLGIQQPVVAVQAALDKTDVAAGTAIIVFAENFGGALFVSVAQNVFTNKLVSQVQQISGISHTQIINTGATDLESLTQDPTLLAFVREAYNNALTQAFLVALILLCVASFGAAGVRWKSIKARASEEK